MKRAAVTWTAAVAFRSTCFAHWTLLITSGRESTRYLSLLFAMLEEINRCWRRRLQLVLGFAIANAPNRFMLFLCWPIVMDLMSADMSMTG